MAMRTIWLAGVALAAALALTGCNDPAAPGADPAPTPAAAPTSTPDRPPANVFTKGHGLEIRYLGDDGTIKVLRPEDFPR